MKDFLKYFLITAGIIVAILAIIFGSVQPLARAQRFISSLGNLGNVKSFDEFRQNFDTAFNLPSPVGDEELAKFLSGDIMNLISQGGQSEDVSRALVAYIEPHMFRNDVRHLLTLANMRAILWKRFQQATDYAQAEDYFLKALVIGPKLPPVLYGLIDLYVSKGDKEKLKQTADAILTYWPSDDNVRSLIQK